MSEVATRERRRRLFSDVRDRAARLTWQRATASGTPDAPTFEECESAVAEVLATWSHPETTRRAFYDAFVVGPAWWNDEQHFINAAAKQVALEVGREMKKDSLKWNRAVKAVKETAPREHHRQKGGVRSRSEDAEHSDWRLPLLRDDPETPRTPPGMRVETPKERLSVRLKVRNRDGSKQQYTCTSAREECRTVQPGATPLRPKEQRVCEECGWPLPEPKPGAGRPQRFCGDTCSARARKRAQRASGAA